MPILIAFAAIIIVVVLISGLQTLRARVRTRRLRRAAESLGFRFTEEGDPQLLHRTAGLLLFSMGQTGEMANVMRGQMPDLPGRPDVAIFEYTFSAPLGRFIESWRQTVVRFSSDALGLPYFSLLPEPVFDQMAANARTSEMKERLMGTAGVRFPDHPEFAGQVHVLAEDDAQVRALLDDATRAAYRAHPGLCVEGIDRILCCYRYDELASPADVAERLEEAAEIYRHLVRSRGTPDAPDTLDKEEKEP
ncbi:MAG: hypothetical protein ACP5HG_08785 [Anaerolineae bacterium]